MNATTPDVSAGRRPVGPRLLGWVLLLPMIAAWVYWLVLPTVRTLAPTGPDALSFAGAGGVLVRSVGDALLPTVVMLVVAPLVALAAHAGGRAAQLVVRVLLAIPVAGFAPAVVYVAMLRVSNASGPDAAWTTIAYTGIACGIAVTVLLAVLDRGADDDLPRGVVDGVTPLRRELPTIAAVLAVLGLGTLAVLLQADNPPLGHDATLVPTLEGMPVRDLNGRSIVLLLVVAVLGVAAALVVLGTRMRIESGPRPKRGPGAPVLRVAGMIAVVVALAVVAVDVVPRVLALIDSAQGGQGGPAGILAHSLIPAVLVALVQVPVAYAAGIAIGALRPAGRYSRWLLLPFAPWLLVTLRPLVVAAMRHLIDHLPHSGFSSVTTQMSPILVSVPGMVIVALFAAGHRDRIAVQGWWRGLLRPSLPLLGALTMAVLLIQAHGLLWSAQIYLPDVHTGANTYPGYGDNGASAQPGSVLLYYQALLRADTGNHPFAQTYALAAPLFVPALIVLIALQIAYLPRLRIRTGPTNPTPAAPEPAPAHHGKRPPAVT